MLKLTEPELDALFLALERKSFLVLGDFCLDAYYFLDDSLSEISIETGLRTEAVKSMRFTPGGAGNVAVNLTAMGARNVSGLGVVGDDLFGREYLALLSTLGIKTDHMVVQKDGWHTCVYTKRYQGDEEKPRIDIGNYNQLNSQSVQNLMDRLTRLLPTVDVVLINQQLLNGIHTPSFRESLKRIILENKTQTFLLDSRDFTDEYDGTYRKLNDREAALAAGLDCAAEDCRHIETVRRAARIISARWEGPVFVTRAERGSLVHDGETMHEIPGLHLLPKIDTVGAGDSIFAGLAAGLAADYTYDRAMLFASLVAGVTIQKRYQTGTAGREEIRSLAQNAEFMLEPEKAESVRTAEYWMDTEIEIIRRPAKKNISFAVFDHDGTISTLREGWESIMEPVMVKAILGEAFTKVDEKVFERVTAEVRERIDKTTGMQTLLQMVELTGMVKDWGYVSTEKILDPVDYKQIYLEALNRMARERMNKIRRSEADVSDFTVKGAVPFLKKLRENGVTLYLASGSDETDVREEAGFMGYADLFNGGIFGAAQSIILDPKKGVLELILNEIGRDNANRIATFGDGPVEMRETWKVGGGCIGVASDEVRRFGLNPHKRKRLILAGADIVIPDFSQYERLCELLFQP